MSREKKDFPYFCSLYPKIIVLLGCYSRIIVGFDKGAKGRKTARSPQSTWPPHGGKNDKKAVPNKHARIRIIAA